MMPDTPPTRLCCGTRHWTVTCPDGLVMCCICFGRFPVNELHEVRAGHENVCLECQSHQGMAEARDFPGAFR